MTGPLIGHVIGTRVTEFGDKNRNVGGVARPVLVDPILQPRAGARMRPGPIDHGGNFRRHRRQQGAAVVAAAIPEVPVGDDEINVGGALGQHLRRPVLASVTVPTVVVQRSADHGANLYGRINRFH